MPRFLAAALLCLFVTEANARPAGCPSRWCGCYMRTQVFSDPGPAFNLARNWLKWGSPTEPTPGAVVVWATMSAGSFLTSAAKRGSFIPAMTGEPFALANGSIAGAIGFRQ